MYKTYTRGNVAAVDPQDPAQSTHDGGQDHPNRRGEQTRTKYTSSSPFTPQYVQSTLKIPDPQSVYHERVANRHERVANRQIALENPARASATRAERDARKERKKRASHRKSLNLPKRKFVNDRGQWKLNPEERSFDVFVHLHQMWMDYISELLALQQKPSHLAPGPSSSMPSAAGMHTKLVKADFLGSLLSVRRSRNHSLVDLSGVVIYESANAFRIITKQDKIKLLPKHGSVFVLAIPLFSTQVQARSDTEPKPKDQTVASNTTVLDIPHIEFELYGNQFQYRGEDRAGRKFKAKETIEL